MTQGLTRQQLGVTEAMIATYGATIFRLSHNHQIRRGDPIRMKDFAAIQRHRGELGMSDGEIAAAIGLNERQVVFIRNLEERRRFRTGHYHRLNKLGGGKRYRSERMTPFQDHFRYGADALALRAALAFEPDQARRYVEAGYWTGDTLRSWLAKHATERPDAPAVISPERTVSYGELKTGVERLAAGLHDLGVRPGDVVAVQLPNTHEYVESFLAIAWLGAVMTTLYMPYREAEFQTQLGHSRAKAVIALAEAGDFKPAATLMALKDKLPALAHVIAIGAAPAGATSYAEVAACGTPLPEDLPVPVAADPFLLLYTSGTTASPKAAPLNYHTMLSNAQAGVPEHVIDADSVILSAAPFGHLFALYAIKLAMCAGAATLLLPIFAPPAFAALIESHKPTHLFAGPAHIAACLGAGLLDKHDMGSVKLSVTSGAAVPPDLVRAYEPKLPNGRVCQLWGMTELQAGMYTRPDDPVERVATSAGRPSLGTEVRIADEHGNALPLGEEGELQVRGPSVFPGYFDNPEASAATFTGDGWFRSGDLATQAADGHVTLTGRLKDVINRGGVKYSPQEVEVLVDGHPSVMQSAIAPIPDPRLGERACCYAVLRPGAALTLDELCDYLTAQGIAKHKLPEKLELRDELPLTATRKVIKSRLAPSA
ncbi:MAG: class I adenylate-forming enzyme family protein [Alphaproteobacteria bacterium]